VPSVKKPCFPWLTQQPPNNAPRRRGFDNYFFGIDIEEAQAISPSQRWVMEVGYEARRFGLRRGLRNWEANVCFFFGGKFMAKVCLLERLEVKWWWWNWCWDADNLINDSSFWDGKSWKSWNSRWINRWSDFGRTCMEMWGETGRRRSKIWDRLYNDILRGPHILIQGGTYRIRRMLFCRLYQAISKWFGTHVNAP
jgi:hypothetical protein